MSAPVAGRGTPAEPSSPPDRETWAQRFEHQAAACGEIGSPLYARLLRLIAEELPRRHVELGRGGHPCRPALRAGGTAAPGRHGPPVGAGRRGTAVGGGPPQLRRIPPEADEALLVAWRVLVDQHAEPLAEGLSREVQTNEVGRAAGLGLALAETGFTACDLVELGCSGGLNLRLDHFDIEVGGLALGRAESPVQLRPELRGHIGALRHEGLAMPQVGRARGHRPAPGRPDHRERQADVAVLRVARPGGPPRPRGGRHRAGSPCSCGADRGVGGRLARHGRRAGGRAGGHRSHRGAAVDHVAVRAGRAAVAHHRGDGGAGGPGDRGGPARLGQVRTRRVGPPPCGGVVASLARWR